MSRHGCAHALRRSAAGAVGGLALLGLSPTAPASAAPVPAAAAAVYRYVDLGVLGTSGGGEQFSDPAAINEAGVVVGASSHTDGLAGHAFLWRSGTMTDLGDGLAGPGGESAAAGVNSSGVVAGDSHVIDQFTPPHAVVWRAGKLHDLGTGYGKGSGSSAAGINDDGLVVGSHFPGQKGPFRAAVWRDGVIRDIGTLGGDDNSPYATVSEADAVNNAGQVVGAALPRSGYPLHGFLWQDGRIRDLGTLGGNGEATVADGINESGAVVGFSQRADGETHGFLWRDGRMRDLGVLGPDFRYRSSAASGINDAGTVVGSSTIRGGVYGTPVATVWRNGTLRDLNTLVRLPAGRRLSFAFDINNSGVIVARSCEIGYCENGGSTDRAVMLVPVGQGGPP